MFQYLWVCGGLKSKLYLLVKVDLAGAAAGVLAACWSLLASTVLTDCDIIAWMVVRWRMVQNPMKR